MSLNNSDQKGEKWWKTYIQAFEEKYILLILSDIVRTKVHESGGKEQFVSHFYLDISNF